MDKPDWNKAPEDATYWAPETKDFNESWYKQGDDCWFCVNVDSFNVFGSPWYGLGRRMLRDDLEPRP